jgi:RHS repeat-associated protein
VLLNSHQANLASSYDIIFQPYFSTGSSARYYGLETQTTWAWDTEPALEGWNLVHLPYEQEVGQADGTVTLASTHSRTVTTYSTSSNRVGWVEQIEHDAQGQADHDSDGWTDDNPSSDEYVTYSYTFPGTGLLQVEANYGGQRTRRSDFKRGTQSGASWDDGAGGWNVEYTATVSSNTGLVTAATDANGNTTRFRYDKQGRLTHTEPPVGAYRDVSYALSSSPPTITETIGGTTSTYTYDGLGRLTAAETSNGTGATAILEQEHDGFDRVEREYLPHTGTAGGWTDTTIDVLGRVTHISQDNGSGVTLDTYTAYSWPSVDYTDAVGHTTTTTLDSYNQAALVTPPDGVTLEALGVGSAALTGRLVDLVDTTSAIALQQLTYTDQAGRPWYFSDWQSGGRVFQRDTAGDVTCTWDDNGDYTVTAFDLQGRPDTLTYGSDCAPIAAPDVSWTYDGDAVPGLTGFSSTNALGRLSAVKDEAGFVEFAYDAGGRIVATRRTGLDLAAGFEATLTRGFDGEGNLDDQVLTFNGGTFQVTSTYGPGNRVETIGLKVTDAPGTLQRYGILVDATYHPSGVPETLTYANGVSETFDFDAYGRPDHVYTTGASDDLDLVYTYDANGHVETLTDTDGTDTYTVDSLGRLTDVTYGDDGTVISYTYDDAGNMTERAGDYAGTFSGLSYSYNHRDDWSWDAAGNLTNDGARSFIWTPDGQLRSANDGSSLMLAGYDAAGRRVVESNLSAVGTTESTFELYDPQGQLVARFVSLGGSWGLQEFYVHAAGRPIAVLSGGSSKELRWLHQDVAGSTRMLTNRGGVTVGTREFLPYGSERAASGTIAGTAFSYAGHEEFNDLGVADFGARSLHEALPRFMSPDRVALGSMGDPQSFNRYVYGANNPVSYVDPGGNFPWLMAAGVLASESIESVLPPPVLSSHERTEYCGWWRGAAG